MMRALRYGLPAVLIVVGFVLLFAVEGSLRWEGWAMCVGSGLAILLMNVLFRFGSRGDGNGHHVLVRRRMLVEAPPVWNVGASVRDA